MKIRLRAALRVLGKEIREASRDRNLVVNLVLVPVFLYPVLGFGAFQVVQVIRGVAERQTTVIGALGEVPAAVADTLNAPENRELVEVPPGREAALYAGDPEAFRAWRAEADEREEPVPDALLVWIPDGAAGAIGGSARDSVAIWYDGARDRSTGTRDAIVETIESWGRDLDLDALVAVGLAETDLDPWPVAEENTASATQVGRWALSLILPLILLVMLTTGTFYSALDTVVGERERGTLETLLVSPLERAEILIGKYLWVLFASVLTLVLNLASMALFLAFVLKLIDIGEDVQVHIAPDAFALIFVTAVLTAAFLSAVLMVAVIPAKTYREGQATLTPLYLATMAPGLVVASGQQPFSVAQACVPLLNSTALFKAALKGETTMLTVAITWAVLVGVTAIVLAVAARIASREDIYLEADVSLRRLLGELGGRAR